MLVKETPQTYFYRTLKGGSPITFKEEFVVCKNLFDFNDRKDK